jgi:hypothetical protein
VEGAVFPHEVENAVDEIVAAIIVNLAERGLTTEMVVAVGVAAWTMQRAFARDLDGEQRGVPFQNGAPGCEQLVRLHR